MARDSGDWPKIRFLADRVQNGTAFPDSVQNGGDRIV